MVAPSQGVHLVVDRGFLPGTHALLVPKTEDGRVLFAVPWLGKTILGTTDTPRDDLAREPAAVCRGGGLHPARGRALPGAGAAAQRRALGVGRPAAAGQAAGRGRRATPRRFRASTPCIVGRSGLVTVTGGKWTTYRAMAEDVLDRAMARGLLPRRPGGVTAQLPLLGAAPGPAAGRAAGRTPLRQRSRAAAHAARRRPLAVARRRVGPGRPERSDGALCRALRDGAQRRGRAGAALPAAVPGRAEAARQADAVAAILAEELGRGSTPRLQGAGRALRATAVAHRAHGPARHGRLTSTST